MTTTNITRFDLKTPNTHIRAFEMIQKSPVAGVIMVHGYGEHINRYDDMISFFTSKKMNVYGYDHHGHGLSSGKKAYVDRFDIYVEDLEAFVNHVRQKDQGSLFLFGHSMGGLVVAHYLLTREPNFIKGIILTGPAFKVSDQMGYWIRKIGALISFVFPKLRTVSINTNLISNNAEEVKKYEKDPLVYHGRTYARTGHEMLKAIDKAHEMASLWRWPLIIAHGTKDGLIDHQGSISFIKAISYEKKELHLLEGYYHELFRDNGSELVFEKIATWLTNHF